jgi:hypothetical protein
MYGPGTAALPPRPTGRVTVVVLRVVFTVLPALTLGLAAWGSVLWLAVRFRRTLDWVLVPVVAVLAIVAFVLIGQAKDESSTQSDVGGGLLMFCMFAVPVYFLVMDLVRSARAPGPVAAAAYGYPGPAASPYLTGPRPAMVTGPIPGAISGPPATHGMTGRPGYGYGHPQPQPYQPHPPQPTPPPGPPAPPAHAPAVPAQPRISQVRAELDELSDYLRKEEGR